MRDNPPLDRPSPRTIRPSNAGANPLPIGIVCRRCGYDLRGIASSGRCPECGLSASISRSAAGTDSWQSIMDGSRSVGNSLGLLVPAFCFAPLSPTLGVFAVVLIAMHAWSHWLGLRELRLGLAAAVADDPILAERLTLASRIGHVYTAIATPAALFPLLPCLIGSSLTVPGGYQLGAMGALVPAVTAALITSRRVGLLIADACAVREEIRREQLGSLGLLAIGPLVTAAWILVAASLVLPPRLGDPLYSAVLPAVLLGLPMLALLWMQWELFALLSMAVPRTPQFSLAARRVEQQSRGPLQVPHDPRSDADLSPLPIVDDEPPAKP